MSGLIVSQEVPQVVFEDLGESNIIVSKPFVKLSFSIRLSNTKVLCIQCLFEYTHMCCRLNDLVHVVWSVPEHLEGLV